jgi:hypothetical protein
MEKQEKKNIDTPSKDTQSAGKLLLAQSNKHAI